MSYIYIFVLQGLMLSLDGWNGLKHWLRIYKNVVQQEIDIVYFYMSCHCDSIESSRPWQLPDLGNTQLNILKFREFGIHLDCVENLFLSTATCHLLRRSCIDSTLNSHLMSRVLVSESSKQSFVVNGFIFEARRLAFDSIAIRTF